MKLLLNARFYSFDTATGQFVPYDSLLLDDGRIAALDETPRGTGVELVDLNGAVVFPAFADCHVHLTDTGYFLGNRDLSRTRSYDDFVSAVEQIPAENGIVARRLRSRKCSGAKRSGSNRSGSFHKAGCR